MLQSWGHKELKMTKKLNNNNISITLRSTMSHVNLGAGQVTNIWTTTEMFPRVFSSQFQCCSC